MEIVEPVWNDTIIPVLSIPRKYRSHCSQNLYFLGSDTGLVIFHGYMLVVVLSFYYTIRLARASFSHLLHETCRPYFSSILTNCFPPRGLHVVVKLDRKVMFACRWQIYNKTSYYAERTANIIGLFLTDGSAGDIWGGWRSKTCARILQRDSRGLSASCASLGGVWDNQLS